MPERTCVACRQVAEKGALLRVVFAGGRFVVDAAQTAPGRGAYLHPACAASPRGRRALPRALRVSGGSPAQLAQALEALVAPEAAGEPA